MKLKYNKRMTNLMNPDNNATIRDLDTFRQFVSDHGGMEILRAYVSALDGTHLAHVEELRPFVNPDIPLNITVDIKFPGEAVSTNTGDDNAPVSSGEAHNLGNIIARLKKLLEDGNSLIESPMLVFDEDLVEPGEYHNYTLRSSQKYAKVIDSFWREAMVPLVASHNRMAEVEE